MPDSAVSSGKAAKRKPKPKLEPIPPSLLELVRQFEDAIAVASASKAGQEMTESAKFVTESGAVNTVQHINAFIESAWNGSMCKNEMGGRKVPLARAIRYLDTIMEATGSMILNAEDADDLGPIFNMKSDKFKMMCTTTFKVRIYYE